MSLIAMRLEPKGSGSAEQRGMLAALVGSVALHALLLTPLLLPPPTAGAALPVTGYHRVKAIGASLQSLSFSPPAWFRERERSHGRSVLMGSGDDLYPGHGLTEYLAREARGRLRVPRVVRGETEVRGSMSKELIHKALSHHIMEIQHCYSHAFSRGMPIPNGSVTIRFVITSTGRVPSSSVRKSTLDVRSVERCLATAVRRWVFPSCNCGGLVMVNQSWLFTGSGPPSS